MATVLRRPGSKYWYAAYRIPTVSTEGKRTWQLLKKCTKETVQAKARKAAEAMEDAALKEAGAGDDGSKRIFALVNEAGEKAAQKKLTLDLGRDIIRRMVELSTGEAFKSYTIDCWVAEWLGQRKSTTKPSTYKRYDCATTAFLDFIGENRANPLEWLTVSHIRAFREKLHGEGRAAKTVNGYTKDIGGVFRAAVREGLLMRSPADNLEPLPEDDSVKRQPFTLDDVAKLVRHAPSDEWRGVILLGAFGGLRLGDAAGLNWRAVDVSEKVIHFTPQKSSRKRGGKSIVLPMHEELVEFFLAQSTPDDPATPCFPTLAKMRVGSRNGLSTTFSKLMDAAKVKRTAGRVKGDKKAGRNTYDHSFHSLRHTFNSQMANGAVSQEMRMKLMGHSETDVNDIYTHLELDSFRAAMKSVPSLPK